MPGLRTEDDRSLSPFSRALAEDGRRSPSLVVSSARGSGGVAHSACSITHGSSWLLHRLSRGLASWPWLLRPARAGQLGW